MPDDRRIVISSELALAPDEVARRTFSTGFRGYDTAEAEIEAARSRGKEMVGEAQAVRERLLTDLARRRRIGQTQVEQLRAGRERLIEAYRVVRRTLDEVTEELSVAEAEARL